jgi:hypothetical protein
VVRLLALQEKSIHGSLMTIVTTLLAMGFPAEVRVAETLTELP